MEKERRWQEAAREDYEFYAGLQWDKGDLAALREQQRPAITINKIRPLIGLLSGWQRLNRYEPEFLPRTMEDGELCKVRKGVTKFVLDRNNYEYVESRMFMDGIICGRGWLAAEYEWNHKKLDGEIVIRRVSPFDMFIDPESKEPDLSDAEYVCRAKWVTKDRIRNVYPEHKEEIDGFVASCDGEEREHGEEWGLWYSRETKKCRLVEVWYREHVARKLFVLPGGAGVLMEDEVPEEAALPEGTETVSQLLSRMRYVTLLGDVVLEEGESPYKHGDFPFVPYVADYTGEVEVALDVQGIIRALKDPQREVNKRRSQSLHIINTTANPIYWVKEGTMAPSDLARFRDRGAVAGGVFRYAAEKPHREEAAVFPMALAQMEEISTMDLRAISGINPEMLGESMPSGTSGKAIELRQRQAVTQIAFLFDNLRQSKMRLMELLWGGAEEPGLIPQYYTEAKVIRIVGESGQPEFVPVNQPEVDGLGQATGRILNDLSVGEFDMVMADKPSTRTQRESQYYALLEAVQAGVAIPPDIILQASDLPQREEILQRMQAEKQAAGPSMPMPKINLSAKINELPPEVQGQLYSAAGVEVAPQAMMAGQVSVPPVGERIPGRLPGVNVAGMPPAI